MKIVFDVKGTLSGYKSGNVWKLFHWFKEQGHEITIWSNSLGYAHDLVNDNHLDNNYMSKFMKIQVEEDELFDIAVEDDVTQDYLGAKNFIWVSDVPFEILEAELTDELREKFKEKYGHLLKEE